MSPNAGDAVRHHHGDRTALTQEEAESRLTSLHYVLLAELPDAGSQMSGLPHVATARFLTGRINRDLPPADPKLATHRVSAELRIMKSIGLAITAIRPNGQTAGWQRTERGAEVLARRQARKERP